MQRSPSKPTRKLPPSRLERNNPALDQMRRKIDTKEVDENAGRVQPHQFFDGIARALHRSRAPEAGRGQFVVRGSNGGVWVVDLGDAEVRRGIGGNVECRISTDAETFSAFINGQNLRELEDQGRITVRGDRLWLAKLGRVLCAPGRSPERA